MACKYKSKLCFSGWCDVACMYCTFTQERNCEHNKKTNADRIRSMSDFELAKAIENAQSGIEIKNPKNIDYFDCILEWIQQPAEENDYETN